MAGEDDRIRQSAKSGILPWDIPPWELPGGLRFDAKPHRGPLLRRLANVAFVCSVLSFYPFGCFLVFCIVESWLQLLGTAAFLALLGSVLGLVVWMLARGDLEEMRTGLIDSEGKWETKFGLDRAVNGFVLGICSLLLWGPVALLLCLQRYLGLFS